MTWAEAWEVLRWVLPIAAGGVGWWVRDRRKDRAAADVAERTVPADVKIKDVGADQAELVYVAQAFEAERSGLRAAIADRDAEIDRQRAELARRDERIASLLQQVAHLEQQLANVSRQLTSVRNQLNELRDHTPEESR